jgi:hypothetical protein
MPKFLIEVRHEPEVVACAKVVRVFLTSGSHFLTNAEWGCYDGDHRAWMIVDVANKAEARAIVPPGLRTDATVVGLNHFALEEIDDILKRHNAAPHDSQ